MKWKESNLFFENLKTSFFPIFLIIVDKQEEQNHIIKEFEAHLLFKKIPNTVLTHENFTLERFYEEVETVPFLSQKRALFIHGVDRFPGLILEKIIDYVLSPNQWTILVFVASKLVAHSKFYIACDRCGGILHLSTKKPWEIEKETIDWLMHLAAKEGVVLKHSEAKHFIEAVGVDRLRLCKELEKVICYLGDRQEITRADIFAISSFISHETIWKLTDALFRKETVKALTISRSLLNQEISIFLLLSTLRTQMQIPLQILSYYRSGGHPAVGAAFPYLKGGVIEKKVQEAVSLGDSFFQKAIVRIGVADRKLRSQTTDPMQIMERLIIELGSI
ncbi:MAG: DNA polymerase III subunit delta [Chlamydiia bacterium]|nr:DNA polymerase III subunit delta [Chlamydiia bacterium]